MYQEVTSNDPREGHMVSALLTFCGRRLFNSYRKLHPSLSTSDLKIEFDSDLGLAIAELKHRRPALWQRMLDAPFRATFEEPEVIGFLGQTLKNDAYSALRKQRSIRTYHDYLNKRAEIEQPAPPTIQTLKEELEEFEHALQAEGLDPDEVLPVFQLQAQGFTRQEIAVCLGLSVRQIGRLITRTRAIAARIRSRRK